MSDTIYRTIVERRTVHEFTDERVPDDVVLAAVEAARWAPNHYLTEPWRFVLIGEETRAQVLALSEIILTDRQDADAASAKVKRWSRVPGWLFMASLREADTLRDQENYAACCCAAQNLQLCLWEQGVGVKWTTGPVTRDERLFELLGLEPNDYRSVGMFWYGWPAQVGEQKRRPVEHCLQRLP